MSNELKELDAFHLSVFMQIFNDLKLQRSFRRSLQSRFPQTYEYIDARYPQLDGRKFSEKCYWLMNGYEDFPKCPVCEKSICTYINIVKGYVLTCSSKCGGIFKDAKYVQYPYFVSSEKLDEVFRDMLRSLNLDFHSNTYNTTIIKHYPYIWNYVYFRYDQLDGHNMPEKLWWFLHNLNSFPTCTVCGKQITAFRNCSFGYSNYCNGCQYNDPQHGIKISQSWHKHKNEDPEFLSRKLQKTIDTNVKNGHPPTWNNSKKAQHTIEEYLKNDPYWKKKCVQKRKNTKKERYGNENYNNPIKNKQTCINRYDVDSYSKTDEFIEKSKATCQKNFGVDFIMQSERGIQLYKQSMIKTYGVENPAQIDEYKAKWKDKDFVERRQQKMYVTKRKNGTFKTSKPEDMSYVLLCEVFEKDDIERQYKDDRYPFLCDFYIKSKDLYIECNYHWTHGEHWFDEKCEDDLKRLQHLKEKNNEKINNGNLHNMYANAINVWTYLDLKKRDTAIKNQLNYKVFWKFNDFYSYIDNLKQSK